MNNATVSNTIKADNINTNNASPPHSSFKSTHQTTGYKSTMLGGSKLDRTQSLRTGIRPLGTLNRNLDNDFINGNSRPLASLHDEVLYFLLFYLFSNNYTFTKS